MTRTGDREIRSVSGRLPDNPGELACMRLVIQFGKSLTFMQRSFHPDYLAEW